jgi:radical SAM-linked protein
MQPPDRVPAASPGPGSATPLTSPAATVQSPIGAAGPSPAGGEAQPRPEASPAPAPPPPAEARQRWRLVYRRRPDAPALAQREQVAAWEGGLGTSGLPLVGLDLPVPRPRLVFAAPLPVGAPADAELLDLFLTDQRISAEVRRRVVASLPAGHDLVDLYDVWLGAPALSGQVVAADYRIEVSAVDGSALEPERLEAASRRLLAEATLPRTRDKGGRAVTYDLRPLLESVDTLVDDSLPAGLRLRIRTRFDPERGVGRPEEVLAALSDAAGIPLTARSIVRERILLAGDRPHR